MDFLTSIKAKARAAKKTIVLPESLEKRNLEAAATTLKEGFADIVLIGNRDEITKAAQEAGGFDVSKATIIDPKTMTDMMRWLIFYAKSERAKA